MSGEKDRIGIAWTKYAPPSSPGAIRRPGAADARCGRRQETVVCLSICVGWSRFEWGTSFFALQNLGFTYQRRKSVRRTWACFRLGFEKSAPHRAISTEQYQHRNKPKGGSPNYSPPVLPFLPAGHSPEFSKGAGAPGCAFWRAESGMLTPRAIMVGQYRLVLAVSTGIRAQGRVLWPSTLQTGQNRANLPR